MLIREIPWVEPVEAMAAWEADEDFALLESGGPPHERARYSYLAVEPFRVLHADAATRPGAFLDEIEAELARWRMPKQEAPLPFVGGAVGFVGYDLARNIGGVEVGTPIGSDGQSQASFGFYDVVIGFDLAQRRAWICASGLPAPAADRARRAADRAQQVLARLERRPHAAALAEAPLHIDWRCALSQPEYEARVAAIIEHIRAGDIYQANFTCRHTAARPTGLSAALFYRLLRQRSPAPFGGLLGLGPMQLASVSPERFIRLEPDGWIETRPIKGTRPRGVTPTEDAALQAELEASAKDRAENLMIVDLMRHDLGRVAEIGSVTVPSLCTLESFASVHHLVSAVRAKLKPGCGPVDLLRATLPGGSITGAPKIRAMQIIDEIEGTPRGAYCGIIGWIGFDGAMDTSIAIRTVTMLPDRLEAQAGGGIVADSDPAEEYAEMLVKVRPLLVGGGV